jgi:hypothetical protein
LGDGLVMKPLPALSLLLLGSMFQVFAFALSFPKRNAVKHLLFCITK